MNQLKFIAGAKEEIPAKYLDQLFALMLANYKEILKNDPYLIENYSIIHTQLFGIIIEDTTKYFAIQNCYFNTSAGISIRNVANHTTKIINNTCVPRSFFNPPGISIQNSYFCTIEDNLCVGKTVGISLYNSSGSILKNNTCNLNDDGFYINYNSNITLIDNSCNNNEVDFNIEDTTNSTLRNNFCNNSEKAISFKRYCYNITVINNILINSGLFIESLNINNCLSYYFNNNSINDKLLGFFTNLNGAVFSESLYGQLFFINCSNLVISNQKLTDRASSLVLLGCNNSVITGNNCSRNLEYQGGIFLDQCFNCSLLSNVCNRNAIGIGISDSTEIYLRNNLCMDNSFMGISSGSSSVIELTENTCNYNMFGIYISNYYETSLFTNNTCTNNYFGIWIIGGYSLIINDICIISSNTLSNNDYFGMQLERADNNVIVFNEISINGNYGIRLVDGSNNNKIHHNNFSSNSHPSNSQGYDSGYNNTWYDAEAQEGNYWSDWSGSGSYAIDGSAGSVDLYPLGGTITTTQVNLSILIPFLILIPWVIKMKSKKKKEK